MVVENTGPDGTAREISKIHYVLLERVKKGHVNLSYVKDVENPADFLTKWLPNVKVGKSVDYVTNRKILISYLASQKRAVRAS